MSPLVSTPFSVEALLQPIRDDAPGGDSLRYEETYRQIQAARKADSGLPQGVWQKAERKADWREVERLSTDALQTKSKDLQIAVWLSEAWLQTRGLNGLQASVELLAGLHEKFLLSMYPKETVEAPKPAEGAEAETVLAIPLSDDIIEHRANLIQNYSERIGLALKFLPLSAPTIEGDLPPHTLADVEKAQHDDLVRRRANADPPAESVTERFEKDFEATPAAWLADTDAQLASAEAHVHALDQVLDRSYGAQNGGLGEVTKVLAAMRVHLLPHLPMPQKPTEEESTVSDVADSPTNGILHRVKQLFSPDTEQDVETSGYDVGANQEPNTSLPTSTQSLSAPSSRVSGRDQAFAQLQEIADYLASTEPHSPVPFLLRRAIRWGTMDFHDLLPELMRHPELLEETPNKSVNE